MTIGAAHAEDNVLPPEVSQQLSALLQGTPGGAIPSAIYTLAGANPEYSDQIACITVQFYGKPDEVEAGVLQGISDPQQQQAVISAVSACSQRNVAGGYGVAITSFDQGIVGSDVNTLSNTQDNVSPIEP